MDSSQHPESSGTRFMNKFERKNTPVVPTRTFDGASTYSRTRPAHTNYLRGHRAPLANRRERWKIPDWPSTGRARGSYTVHTLAIPPPLLAPPPPFLKEEELL